MPSIASSSSSSSSSPSIDSIVSKLLSRSATDVPLTPRSPWDTSLADEIQSLKSTKGRLDVLKAAMHLCNDDLHNAHELAQAHEESMTANLCHAILHRREQDYWNSKWWLSRIKHPLLSQIHSSTQGAKNFVDEVERVEESSSPSSSESTTSATTMTTTTTTTSKKELQEKQWKELRAVLEYALKEVDA